MSGTARRFAESIKAIGGTVYLVRDGERLAFLASIQPRSTGKELDSEPLGFGNEQLYHLYTAAEGNGSLLTAGDLVTWKGQAYYVLRAEPFTLHDEVVYYKAILRKGVDA
jgi:hypothetical protein